MIKKLFILMAASAFLFSCGNKATKENVSVTEIAQDVINIDFESLVQNPYDYIGKNIKIEGKVIHVCRMSGKKMFITGDNPDIRLYISAGEKVSKFPMELLGNEITVEGVLAKAETQEITGENHAGSEEENCETEDALAAQSSLADLMMIYNKHDVVK